MHNSVSRPRPKAGTRFGRAGTTRLGPDRPDRSDRYGRSVRAREGAGPRSEAVAVERLGIGLGQEGQVVAMDHRRPIVVAQRFDDLGGLLALDANRLSR